MAAVQIRLTRDEYDRLQQVCTECRMTQDYIEKCEACELNVEQEKADNAKQLQIAETMLKQFFPNGRPKK